MNDPFQGYDQWKTASPYDDDPDPVDEACRFLEHLKGKDITGNERWARAIIEQLLELI
jgi:hypothetical protein